MQCQTRSTLKLFPLARTFVIVIHESRLDSTYETSFSRQLTLVRDSMQKTTLPLLAATSGAALMLTVSTTGIASADDSSLPRNNHGKPWPSCISLYQQPNGGTEVVNSCVQQDWCLWADGPAFLNSDQVIVPGVDHPGKGERYTFGAYGGATITTCGQHKWLPQ